MPLRRPLRPRRHGRTIRLRLTLLYGGVFLITGAVLLTIGYLMVRHNLFHHHALRQEAQALDARRLGLGPLAGPPVPPHGYLSRVFREAYTQAADNALNRLMYEYVGAVAVMTAVSVGAGWLLAGRALAPLRAITSTARRVSGENLGERIALDGPEDELKELADTFDGMLVRLDAAFASQRTFVANASHELRTPLAIMRTEIDVALADREARPEELRAMGEAVRETIDRSEALISRLLMLARSEAVAIPEQPVDLTELASDALSGIRRQAEAAEIRLDGDLRPAVARGDGALLHRMVGNLLENAVRHNEPGGHVRVATATEGEAATLVVENSGPQLSAAVIGELTQPFRRINRAVGGFGLGLSIVSSVVAAHGGRLELAPRAAGGLGVRVMLPRAVGVGGETIALRRRGGETAAVESG